MQLVAATVRSVLHIVRLILRPSQQIANRLLQKNRFGLHAVVAHRAV